MIGDQLSQKNVKTLGFEKRRGYGIKTMQKDPLFSSSDQEDFLSRGEELDLHRMKSLETQLESTA
jgi:hypothetical protein